MTSCECGGALNRDGVQGGYRCADCGRLYHRAAAPGRAYSPTTESYYRAVDGRFVFVGFVSAEKAKELEASR